MGKKHTIEFDKRGPFHKGEKEIQARANVRPDLEENVRCFITDNLPYHQQSFFSSLPMVFIGAEDSKKDLWSSMLFGDPGFIRMDDSENITLCSSFSSGDPIVENLPLSDDIGLLGIKLESRDRSRISAVLTDLTETTLSLKIKQSYINCPKYIQSRKARRVTIESKPETIAFKQFDKALSDFIETVDTLFLASLHVENKERINQGVDCSHRGGMPGFVKVIDENTLVIPDYIGNNFFNTLGNITLDPRMGIQFLDFDHGHRLMLTGTAETVWASDEDLPFDGVDRMIRFTLKHGFHLKHSLPFEWELKEHSPFSKAYAGHDLGVDL